MAKNKRKASIKPMPEEILSEGSGIDLKNPTLYINRELSMLEFQRRVLEEAMDESNPLLERVKFLGILGSNLDEFFMVRVGGLILQRDEGVIDLSIDGLTAAQQLVEIRKSALKLLIEARDYWNRRLLPQLDDAGIHVRYYKDLTTRQKQIADAYFHETVFPVLTPLAFDPGHPFPHISNLSLNLAVILEGKDKQPRFARVKVPDTLPQMVPIKRSSGSVRKDGTVPRHHYFIWLADLILSNLDDLFPGLKVLGAHLFRVTRNVDMEIQELEAADLLETIEESVRKRRFGTVVRLMVRKDIPNDLKEMLIANLRVDRNDVYVLDSPLNLRTVSELTRVERHELKDRPFIPYTPQILRFGAEADDDAIFSAIQRENILLHHPYDSFTPVVEFLKTEKPENVHVVITGRNAKDELIEVADLVTEMEQVKHPFRSGVKPQSGIEY